MCKSGKPHRRAGSSPRNRHKTNFHHPVSYYYDRRISSKADDRVCGEGCSLHTRSIRRPRHPNRTSLLSFSSAALAGGFLPLELRCACSCGEAITGSRFLAIAESKTKAELRTVRAPVLAGACPQCKLRPSVKEYSSCSCNFPSLMLLLHSHLICADVAQSVEQLIRNQQAAGSNPAISSNTKPLEIAGLQGVLFFAFAWNSLRSD